MRGDLPERLLSGLDANEREQLAALLRKLLLSEPFRSLDPATEEPARPARDEAPAEGLGVVGETRGVQAVAV